jgi:hypothetical protein
MEQPLQITGGLLSEPSFATSQPVELTGFGFGLPERLVDLQEQNEINTRFVQRARPLYEEMFFMAYVERVGPVPIIEYLRDQFGTAPLKKAINRQGQPRRSPRLVLAVYLVIETAKGAKGIGAKAACDLIVKLGGFPRHRDTINPLERVVYDNPSTLRALHWGAVKRLRQGDTTAPWMPGAVENRIERWRASGMSYEAWERRNLRVMREGQRQR